MLIKTISMNKEKHNESYKQKVPEMEAKVLPAWGRGVNSLGMSPASS